MARHFPTDCIQGALDYGEWWETNTELRRGALVQALIPFYDQVPSRLAVQGRSNPTDHTSAKLKIEKFDIRHCSPQPKLPVAGLTLHHNESLLGIRAKVRPALVMAIGETIDQGSFHHRAACILLVPYYGMEPATNGRKGFDQNFIAEVKRGEYRQFMWDLPPASKQDCPSLLRFDRMLSVTINDQGFYRLTNYSLSNLAQDFVDDWLCWYLGEVLAETTGLYAMLKAINPNIP